MESDQQLMELFDAATSDLRPPIAEIYQQSVSRGKRLRRRRNARVLLGTASVLAVSVGAVLTLPHLGTTALVTAVASSSPSAQATASPGLTMTPSTGPTASQPATPTSSGTEVAPTEPTFLVPTSPVLLTTTTGTLILKSLLPAGGEIVGPMPNPYTLVDVEYTDGHGTSELTVDTQSVATYRGLDTCAGWLGGTNEGPRPADAPPAGCTLENLPGGAKEIVAITGTDGSGFYDIETSLMPVSGFVVTVTTTNGLPMGATVDVTRSVPPLTVAQTKSIAADPRWQAQ